jgi:hypothetical protein
MCGRYPVRRVIVAEPLSEVWLPYSAGNACQLCGQERSRGGRSVADVDGENTPPLEKKLSNKCGGGCNLESAAFTTEMRIKMRPVSSRYCLTFLGHR